MKKVMHIAEAPGGVERYLVVLLEEMKKYPEFEHILVCSNTFDREKFDGLVKAVTVIDDMHNSISLREDSKAVVAVRKAIKRYEPDFIYCHSSKAGAIGRIADIGIKNKLIYNAHGWAFNMRGTSGLKIKFYELVEKMLAPMADKIVCISEYEKKSALEHKICKKDKLVLINSGINFDEFKNLQYKSRKELGVPENAFVVGAMGRLAKQKAPDIFVKMAEEVKKRIPEAFFVMIGDDIGDGKIREETERQIKNANLKKDFLITNWVNNPLVYVGVLDVVTLLSRWEGFGLVLPECMLMGKPIVATKADSIPYVVGDAGLLVDVDNYEQAAEAVIKLYENKELRDRMIKAGKERVKLFNAERTAKETVELFD